MLGEEYREMHAKQMQLRRQAMQLEESGRACKARSLRDKADGIRWAMTVIHRPVRLANKRTNDTAYRRIRRARGGKK